VVTLPNYMKLILNFRLLINFDRPIPLCAPVQFSEEDLTDIRKVIQNLHGQLNSDKGPSKCLQRWCYEKTKLLVGCRPGLTWPATGTPEY
jgi:hypothetical protein